MQDTILHAGKRRAVSQHGLVNQRKAIFQQDSGTVRALIGGHIPAVEEGVLKLEKGRWRASADTVKILRKALRFHQCFATAV
ncbi:Uncharacterised protein [Klebsiella pneumoniae]|nr:Uncharacterised protein [Klebsiella pneumoniae]VAS21249.1 Uncharacterised protein [Klebsiella pneumoniae]